MTIKVKRTDRHEERKEVELFDFRLNTLLECGDVRVIISTVGKFARPKGMEDIFQAPWIPMGADRYYETAIWHAMRINNYWDADIRRGFIGNHLWGIVGKVDDNSDEEAKANHENAVKEFIGLLARGETFGQGISLDPSLN